MARDADTIQAEIERARDALAVTVDELTIRANPKKLVNDAKQTVTSKLSAPKVKYALIGVGVLIGALIVRRILK
ncbi:DUF3618 domain-containing protein [Nakamurella antarctica]|uniref:DUF3618 domain-containing protein n=1 Tax=Nakamurella antarctica TaxID=1902245 RepID=A0A3G8ZNF7_9ACTN|nr:DUF3618 domain-containing protein [Nakamurella antarctica]AZI58335.1 DUF3618 domain-containing protein [Nakamurella antarctica]